MSAEVRRYWQLFVAKDEPELLEFYAHESTIFGAFSARPEPARLALTRRAREYFGPRSILDVKPGEIEVVMLGDHAAVANYNFELHASHLEGRKGGEVHFTNGRATQVFGYDHEGRLRIFHEHLSLPAV